MDFLQNIGDISVGIFSGLLYFLGQQNSSLHHFQFSWAQFWLIFHWRHPPGNNRLIHPTEWFFHWLLYFFFQRLFYWVFHGFFLSKMMIYNNCIFSCMIFCLVIKIGLIHLIFLHLWKIFPCNLFYRTLRCQLNE